MIMFDFAENYSFMVQDEVQGFHWNNAQATLHPFLIYSRRHKKVPVPYSCYDRKTVRSVKRYDPITVQIVVTVVLFTP